MEKLYRYGLAVWAIFVVLAIINGAARESLYEEDFGELAAHQLSSVIFIAAIFIVTYAFLRTARIKASGRQYLILGLMWVCLTVIFEFGFGHFVMGNAWETLLADYNIFEGRLWAFVLIATLFAPWVVGKISESR